MSSPHDIDTWLAETRTRPQVFNHNPRLAAAEFKGFELANEVTMVNADGATERVYLFARKGGKDEVLLRISVCDHDSDLQALFGLRGALDHMMNPDIARAAGKGAKAAGIGFEVTGEGGEGAGAAMFSIGNVSVTVHSAGDKPVGVAAAAAHVGRLLAGAPDKAALGAGRVEAFSPQPVRLGAGEQLTLVEELPEDGPEAARIQVVAPDGEFRREGRSLLYLARADGPQRISLFTHRQRAG